MDYENKNQSYYSNIRKDLVQLINKKNYDLKVLEIGAAYGETLNYIKENKIASEVVGIDLYEDKNHKERYKNIDRFIFGNIEEINLPEYEGYFDVILLPDVLEHLLEPKKALDKVHKYLKSTGEIIVSVPNIRHYSALYKIFFKGSFKYEESGIFDYTHLRFYCKKDIEILLETSNFKTVKVMSSIRDFKGKSIIKLVNKFTFYLFEEFFSQQYFFISKKV